MEPGSERPSTAWLPLGVRVRDHPRLVWRGYFGQEVPPLPDQGRQQDILLESKLFPWVSLLIRFRMLLQA